jgi:uncharacterized protein YcnI
MKHMIKRILTIVAIAAAVVGLNVGIASAHVVVKPDQVETAAFQSFTTGVPNEKGVPVTKVRLVMPDGVAHVTPNVKPGWTIDTVKEGEGEDAKVKEITWSGGQIPAGQRDDFVFSAQAPDKAGTLQWKAYQTYADGSEVAWDQAPSGKDDDEEGSKPYSETSVVDQAANEPGNQSSTASSNSQKTRTSVAIALSVVALITSVVALTRRR